MAEGASARLLAGPDELFGTQPRFPVLDGVELWKPTITVRPYGGLAVAFSTEYLRPLDEWIQQVLGVSYTSPCGCWGVGFQLAYRYPFPQYPEYPNFQGFSLSLGGIASL